MADITKCANETCPLKAECYRHTATDNPWRQSYADFAPTTDELGRHVCEDMIDMRKR